MRILIISGVVAVATVGLLDLATCKMYGKAYGLDTSYMVGKCNAHIDGGVYGVAYHDILPF